MSTTRTACAAIVAVLTVSTVTLADYIPGDALTAPALTGATSYDGWIGLTSSNYPGYGAFPGTAAWPEPIGSNRTASNTFDVNAAGDATLMKTANGSGGGIYPSGGALYFGGFSSTINNPGGTLTVTDETPVANVSNIVFQVQIGEAWTYDFVDELLPTLSYNDGAQALEPDFDLITDQFYNGTVEMPTGPEDVYINTYLVQWDLTGVSETITTFDIEFSGVQHAQVYGLQLDQSDAYTPLPEPASALLLLAGGLAVLRRR